MIRAAIALAMAAGACGGDQAVAPAPLPSAPPVATAPAPATATVATTMAMLPRAPGGFGPSMVTVAKRLGPPEDTSDGALLADVDGCASCHPDAAAQWSASAHSFASFGNPIYRFDVDQVRADLGKQASRHCGGCHDMPLMADGLMTADAPIPADDLRSHSGVTCRLCHGVRATSNDGNGSYVWDPAPIEVPKLGDAASVARHKQQVTTFGAASQQARTELCVGCHRGFVSPDMGVPVHLSGLEEVGFWRNSAFTGNGMGRIDKVDAKTCIDCHMEREPASASELGAVRGTIASHRFVGGHTWMASMRDDREHLRRTRAKLEGAASLDIAAAAVFGDASGGGHRLPARTFGVDSGLPRPGVGPGETVAWYLPADGAPVTPGAHVELDVVARSLLVGHRFPGGVLDIQDTWIEVEVADRAGRRIAASGLAHATDRHDREAHVLRTIVVDEHGRALEEHEMAKFRAQIATQTLAPREAQAVRYAFDVPAGAQLPLVATARLRHRSRSLAMQDAVCRSARTDEGRAFIAGARGARTVALDPCKPQPITLVAEARVELGAGASTGASTDGKTSATGASTGGKTSARPAWERMYEHGMALVATVAERQGEARTVLEAALAAAPDARSRAMVAAQLAASAARQGRVEDTIVLV
ncbi:MAG: hypothetical protein KIT31_31785, partial [Deltaproteobacteria bacterium]|nr:hypothetical protein [Deltaproteobacteria bacterium]